MTLTEHLFGQILEENSYILGNIVGLSIGQGSQNWALVLALALWH